jgi:hypothetical protein
MSDTAPPGPATITVAAPSTAPAGEPRFLFWWVAIVGVLLTLGAVGVLTYLRGEIRAQNLLTALDDAENFASSVTQFNFFSAEIVPRARAAGQACRRLRALHPAAGHPHRHGLGRPFVTAYLRIPASR